LETCFASLTENAVTWQSPALVLDLRPGQVHVWKADLDEIKDAWDCLSEDEKLRAARLKSPEKSARFRNARAVLRGLLAAYTHQSPQDIRLIYGARGKPSLQPEPGAPMLEFNLSHCGNLLLAAFSAQAPVGIDLELIQPIEQQESILRQYFTAHDWNAYRAMPVEQQNCAFLRAWICREAVGKADGAGFAFGSEMDFFTKQACDPSAAGHRRFVNPDDFWLLSFSPQSGSIAALAVKSAAQPQTSFFELTSGDNLIGFSRSQGLKMQTIYPFSGYMKERTPAISWK
jgi:4'-phosphopantetheinyl transferase